MMQIKVLAISIIAVCCTELVYAQKPDSTIANQNIDIIQTYTPEVTMPVKPNIKPTALHLQSSSSIVQNYEVPSQQLSFSYDAVKIKPLALGKFEDPVIYQNYAALGLGNFSTLLADLGLTYHEDGKYDAYVHAYHFSQKKGAIADRKSSNTDIRAGGKYFLKQYELYGDINYNRLGTTYYGYDHQTFLLNPDDIKQVYNLFDIKGGIGKINFSKYAIGIEPSIHLYHYTGTQNGNENGIGWKAPVSYALSDNLLASLSLDGMLTSYNSPNTIAKNTNYILLHPSILYNKEKFYLKAGFAAVNSTGNNFGLLPKINLRYALGDSSKAAVSAGWDGDVIMNSFKNLSQKNPFIAIPNTAVGLESRLYGGLELAMLHNLKFNGKVAYHRYNKYNNFTNQYSLVFEPSNTFSNAYVTNINIFSFQLGAQWLITNIFELGGGFTFFGFPSKPGVEILGEAPIKFDAVAKFRPIEGLSVVGNLNILSGIKYKDESWNTKQLATIPNLGFHIQYDFMKRFGAFLSLDNVLNANYQRWYKYEVYGFNIFGGVKVKF